MFISPRIRTSAICCLLFLLLILPASAQILSPDFCYGNSVLPSTYQVWQEGNSWMGLAVSPQNPAVSVFLEVMQGEAMGGLTSYEPPVISELLYGTNFAVKNFAAQPDRWLFPRTYTEPAQNLAHIAQYSPGDGVLPPATDRVVQYGGLAQDCGMIRVFTVDLTAGQTYRFELGTTEPDDQLRMALLRESTLPDGWVTRSQAYFEKDADPLGREVSEEFVPAATGSYALVVFLDDMTAFGGQYTLRYEEYTSSPDLPDLRVASYSPPTPVENVPEPLSITVENIGGAASAACVTAVSIDGAVVFADLPTAAIPGGGTTTVNCTLPGLAAGQHTLLISVDDDGAVPEDSETNNTAGGVFQVTGPPQPDLIVAWVTPSSLVPNQPSEIYINILNQGSVAAASSETRLELDGGAQTFTIPTPSIPAQTHAEVSVTLPGLSAGSHSALVRADHGGVVSESNESNNEFTHPLVAEGANLFVSSLTPLSVVGNVAPVFEVTVTNDGTLQAASGYARVDVNGQVLQALYPAIGAGQSATVECLAVEVLPPGSHPIEACADATNTVVEIDESDNCLSATVEVVPSSAVVNPSGTGDYPTIQAAIDAVVDGGQVLLVPGVYTGDGNRDITFRGKSIAVTSAFDGRAVIDCQGNPDESHRGFIFNSGETNDAVLARVDIINGYESSGVGGGILCYGSGPTIEDVLVRDCHADEGGGMAFSGTFSFGLRVIVRDCTIVGNGANHGGGLYLGGDAGVEMSTTLIAQNWAYGGAVSVGVDSSPTLELTCCDLWGNSGGDYTTAAAGQLGIRNNINQDPLFCDAAANDYTVAGNSPCAEAVNQDCGRIGALDVGCGPLGGTVRHVQADGNGEFPTIQNALNNCVPGDIVELADGVYTGTGNRDINPLGLAVIIRSASGDPIACRLDGQDSHRLFAITSGEGADTVIQNLGIVNGAADIGAGILCNASSPTLDGLRIWDCDATDDGGAVHCEDHASPTLDGCTFENNTAADDGGALYAHNYSSPTVSGCLFLGNLSGDRGGGADFTVNSFPSLTLCTFVGNEAVNGGGLIFVYAYGPVNECVFVDNTATYGGAAQCYGNAQVDFVSCTMHANKATNGAQIYLRNNSSPTIAGSILSGGSLGASMARYADDCLPSLSCTDIWDNEFGDYPAFIADQLGVDGNLRANPLYCNASIGNLYLRGDSPCAAANNVDCGQIGALPVGCSGSWLVRADGSGDFATIQAAIDAAAPGESVVLADGVYTGDGNRELDLQGKAITIRSQSGDAAQCIIDCGGSETEPHWGFQIDAGESTDTVLENFTIRNGWRLYGGGGRIDDASPTLRGIVFRDNAGGDGGGLIVSGGNPQLEQCVFENNTVDDAGGGLYLNTSFAILTGCEFRNNSAFWGGGGLYNQHAGPNVLECTFVANTSSHWGGAVHNRYADSAPNFTRCVFTGNAAPTGGALYHRDGTTPSYTGCTFVGNSSTDGAVLRTRTSSVTNMVRCIMAYGTDGGTVTWDGTGNVTAFCCDVYGNAGGDWTGPLASQQGINDNFTANPVFCDRFAVDFHLADASPCQPEHSPCGLLVGALDVDCEAVGVPDDSSGEVPANLVLDGAVPNPFNPTTTIIFALPTAGPVDVAVYGVDGKRVAGLYHGSLPAGYNQVAWHGRDQAHRRVASGVYFVQVATAEEVKTCKIMLAR